MNGPVTIARKPMLLPGLEAMRGYTVRGRDGAIGRVYDWYFDDADWEVRYLVADHGRWRPGKRMLIPPSVCGAPDPQEEELPVALERREVASGPDWDQLLPVSRQHLEDLRSHYGWESAWPVSAMAGTAMLPGTPPPPPAEPAESRRAEAAGTDPKRSEAHLRSLREVTGYAIHATDGEIGRVRDLLCGQDPWRIRYLVVATRRWWPGHEVLLPVGSVRGIDWVEGALRVRLSRNSIRHSPVYEPKHPIGRAYENALHDHYELPRYWQSENGGRS